jgi:hypothetical protein
MRHKAATVCLCLALTALAPRCVSRYHPPLPLNHWYIISPVYFDYEEGYRFGVDAPSPAYGLSPDTPVPTASFLEGADLAGIPAQQFYLSHLLCPEGEAPRYFRAASCCTTVTENGVPRALDRYKLICPGSHRRFTLYLDGGNQGEVYAPPGLLLTK